MSTDRKPDDQKSSDSRIFSRDDLSRMGGDILQKTLGGLDALREGLPKEAKGAAQYIMNRKDDLVKGFSKELIQSLITGGIETFFSVVRQHRLELTIGIRKTEEDKDAPTKERAPKDRGKRKNTAEKKS